MAVTSVSKDVGQLVLALIAGRNGKWYSYSGKQFLDTNDWMPGPPNMF